MLGAILCNLPYFWNSGPFHGQPPGRAAHGTGWNKNWATEYGPDVDKARKARPDDVQEAIKALSSEVSLPPLFDDAVDVAKRSLAADLMRDDESLVIVMTAYYAYLRWCQQEEDDIIALLMLC
jgi:hypothetical protein